MPSFNPPSFLVSRLLESTQLLEAAEDDSSDDIIDGVCDSYGRYELRLTPEQESELSLVITMLKSARFAVRGPQKHIMGDVDAHWSYVVFNNSVRDRMDAYDRYDSDARRIQDIISRMDIFKEMSRPVDFRFWARFHQRVRWSNITSPIHLTHTSVCASFRLVTYGDSIINTFAFEQ